MDSAKTVQQGCSDERKYRIIIDFGHVELMGSERMTKKKECICQNWKGKGGEGGHLSDGRMDRWSEESVRRKRDGFRGS